MNNNWNGESKAIVGQMVLIKRFSTEDPVELVALDSHQFCSKTDKGFLRLHNIKDMMPIPDPEETTKQKAIDENQRLREQLDAWAEKYADLKIKSDANQWAHDNMKKQLASAKADGIREAIQYATSNHTKGVRAALRKYIELLEGKGNE